MGHNRVLCEHCPAWHALKGDDGERVLYPLLNGDQPKLDGNGKKIYFEIDGQFVYRGHCTLEGPRFEYDQQQKIGRTIMWPETASIHSCESERKHELMKLYGIGPYAPAKVSAVPDTPRRLQVAARPKR